MSTIYKTHNEITQWLDDHGLKNYTLTPHTEHGFTVDVDGDVDLSDKALRHIPIKFGSVSKNFTCSHNQLQSLHHSPVKVGLGYYCDHNQLTSLEGAPKLVGNNFVCSDNFLTDLSHSPSEVKGHFSCSHNLLITLEGCPETVDGSFLCYNNKLINLKGSPQIVHEYFFCEHNQIDSLEFCPQSVGGKFQCHGNSLLGNAQNITNFSDIYKIHLEFKKIKEEKHFLSQSIFLPQKFDQKPQHKI